MKTLFSAVIFALLLLNAPVVNACSCSGYPAVCDSYQAAGAVFIGVVQRVQTNTAKDEDGEEYTTGQVAHIQVEKSFKGMAQPEVVFHTEGSSCDPTYQEGQRWLFYAYQDRKTKTWGIAACDRSKKIEGAAEDLLYLQGLPKSASTTRLSGEVVNYEDDCEGKFINRFGGAGDQPGQFRAAYSIAVDGHGRVYVGDAKGIQVFDANGRYLTLVNLKGVAFGMVFNDKNELLVIARDRVIKYAVQAQ